MSIKKKRRSRRRLNLPYRRIIPRATAAAFTFSLSLWVPQVLHAGDIEGANVVQGQATIAAGVDPSVTNITASDRAIIEYQKFNIASQSTVNFIQPSSTAAVLNRIVGNSPSTLNGTLNANGHVYFVNPAGVFFGPGSIINAGRFHAAAGNITNEDFAAGINRFTASGTLTNEGSITAVDGVYLVGQQVNNTGTIVAANGLVSLSSGDTEYIADGDSRVLVKVDSLNTANAGRPDQSDEAGTGVSNTGTIDGDEVVFSSGDIYSLAIANTGTVNSNSTVTVASSGDVTHSGDIAANGKVDVAGDHVTLDGGSITAEGELNVYANDLTLGSTELSAGEGGHILLDPETADIDDATAIVSGLGNGSDVTVEATQTVNVNTAIDTSAQGTNATLAINDEDANNDLTVNLNALIDLGANQTLTGQGTTVNVNHTADGGIQNGIDVAAAGGSTVNLAPGTYNVSNTIDMNKQGLTLAGPQQGVDPRTKVVVVGADGVATESTVAAARDFSDPTTEAIINGGGIGRIIEILAADTTLDGLTVTNSSGDMIYAPNPVDNTTIQNNFIHDSGDEGVQLRGATNSRLQFNSVFDIAGDGLNVSVNASNNFLQFNQLDNIRSTNAAIYIYTNSTNNTIQGNVISNVPNNEGVKVGVKSSGADEALSGGSVLTNVIRDIGQDGIAVYMSDVLVQGNNIFNAFGNHAAVYVSFDTDNVTINNNNLHDNGTRAIQIGAGSLNPTNISITNNNIENNNGGVLYHGNDAPTVTGNTFRQTGTHYDDPTGLTNLPNLIANNTFDQGGFIEGANGGGGFTLGGEDIEALIEGASNNDVVRIFSGNYNGDILVGASGLQILGPNAGLAPDDPNRVTEAVLTGGFRVQANDFTLDGMTVQEGVLVNPDNIGVFLQNGTSGHTIRNNFITGTDVAQSQGVHTEAGATSNITLEYNDISQWGVGSYFNPATDVTVMSNIFQNNNIGLAFDGAGQVDVHNNFFVNNTTMDLMLNNIGPNFAVNHNSFSNATSAITNDTDSGNELDASANFFGSTDLTTIDSLIDGDARTNVDFSPALLSGTDTDPDTFGFQPEFGSLLVHQEGSQVAGHINEGVNLVDDGGTVQVGPGTYPGLITLDKAVNLQGANSGINPNTDPRGAESIIQHNGFFSIRPAADNITIDGFTFNGNGSRVIDATGPANNLTIINNIFNNVGTSPFTGIIQLQTGPFDGLVIRQNQFNTTGTGDNLVIGAGDSTGVQLIDNHFGGELGGVFQNGGLMDDFLVQGNEFTGSTGLNMGNTNDLRIIDNHFHDMSGPGFQVGGTNIQVLANVFERVPFDAMQFWGGEFGTTPANNVTILNNEVTYNDIPGTPSNGIRLRGPGGNPPGIDASTFTIRDNLFINGGANDGTFAIRHQGDQDTTLDASNNAFGTNNPNDVVIEGDIVIIPLLDGVEDTDPNTPGFQPSGDLVVLDNFQNVAAQNSNDNSGSANQGGSNNNGGGNVSLALGGGSSQLPLSVQLALNDQATGGGNLDPDVADQLDQLFENFLNNQLSQFQLALNQQYDDYIVNVSNDLSVEDRMAGFYQVTQQQQQLNTQFSELLIMIEAIDSIAQLLGLDEAEARKMLYEEVKPANMSTVEFDALVTAYRQAK